MSLVVRNARENTKLGVEVGVHGHDGRYITAAVAVVGGGPDSDDGFLGEVELRLVSKLNGNTLSKQHTL